MDDFRFILEKATKKHTCPECGKKMFVRYIDTATSKHLPDEYGRCDREVNCAYWLNPYKDGYFKMICDQERGEHTSFNLVKHKPQPKPEQKPDSLIEKSMLDKSLSAYEVNNFISYLLTLFPLEAVEVLIARYLIGTSKHWEGATVFWQVDTKGRIKAGKVMLYNPSTGKRVKEPYNHITWVHSALKLKDYNLKQCMFGEHLLVNDKTSPVAIVESEKTAVIASAYLPELIWLACGSLSNLNESKCEILKGRKVVLFPDLNGFSKWSEKAVLLSRITSFEVSNLLECNATEVDKEKGLDLADYLVQFNCQDFAPQPTKKSCRDEVKASTVLITPELRALTIPKPVESWDIKSLEDFFAFVDIPSHPIKLSQEASIENVELFIKTHLSTVKMNNGKRTFLPYLERLQELKAVIEKMNF